MNKNGPIYQNLSWNSNIQSKLNFDFSESLLYYKNPKYYRIKHKIFIFKLKYRNFIKNSNCTLDFEIKTNFIHFLIDFNF